MSDSKPKHTVKINFDNLEAAKGFLSWLCESGEQSYWDYQTYREEDNEEGDITAIAFNYWAQSSKEFCKGLEVNAECGRLDDDGSDDDEDTEEGEEDDE